MNKKLFLTSLIVAAVILSLNSFGQTTSYPRGGYKTFEEFQKKQPSIPFVFEIIKRKRSDIKMSGGVDYKIISDTIGKSTISKKIYAISSGDTLYINCYIQGVQFGYAKVLVEGKYIAFQGGIPSKNNSDIALESYLLGPIGGGIAGARAALIRYLYVMESNVGKITLLDGKYLTTLLEPFPDLKNQYSNEPEKEKEATLLKYLSLINSNSN